MVQTSLSRMTFWQGDFTECPVRGLWVSKLQVYVLVAGMETEARTRVEGDKGVVEDNGVGS